MRLRNQRGCLRCTRRKIGPPCWEFLWRENDAGGNRTRRICTGSEDHSYRSASIGLTEAALRDGKNVKIRSMVMAAAKEKAAVPRSKTKGNPTESLMR